MAFSSSAFQHNAFITTDLVRRLIPEQFPNYADLKVEPVELSGNDHKTYHLGDAMLIRMPSAQSYAPQAIKEQKWLPELAKHMTVPYPRPFIGAPPIMNIRGIGLFIALYRA